MTITKTFGVDFGPSPNEIEACSNPAYTLPAKNALFGVYYEDQLPDDYENTIFERKHRGSGWTIRAPIHADYYTWINEFEAEHAKHGKVWGDFESEVHADSEAGFRHFVKHHPPVCWDYGDI